jgi:hypothetical protein
VACHKFHMAWFKPNIYAISYVVFKCHVACHKFHGAWFRPNICAMFYVVLDAMWHVITSMWHGLGLAYVPCPMMCLSAMWDGLDLAYVPHGMA